MSESLMFREAMSAIEEGDQFRARDLLARLLRADKSRPEYWLYMSSVVETKKEQIYCLKSVLRLDPDNHLARQGLVMFGELSAEEGMVPAPLVRRNWEVEFDEQEEQPSFPKQILPSRPLPRVLMILGVVAIVSVVILYVFFGRSDRPLFKVRLTITPIPWTLTPSVTPTRTPRFRTSTPTPAEAQPLWMLLEATYTPTPLYVNTPHPRTEAYRAGLRAYERGDYESMLSFMQQAAREELDSPDTQYYVGEAYRLMDEYALAIEAYDEVLEIDPDFAPVYLARARLNLSFNRRVNILEDLNLAIELDPTFGGAYLERAAYWVRAADYQQASEDLQVVRDLLPESALGYLIQAQVDLGLGDSQDALQNAFQAYQRDITLLPAYLVLGRAYLVNEQPEKAVEYLNVYMLYEKEDPEAWTLLGRAQFHLGEDFVAALEAFDTAIDLDPEFVEAYLYRGLTNLALDQGQDAVNDLFEARGLFPESFEINLAFGQALFSTERYEDAYAQINASLAYTNTLADTAAVFYWNALSLEALERHAEADQYWQALTELPEEVVPVNWLTIAEQRLQTPTPTSTITPTPANTATSTSTDTPEPTKTPTYTPSQTFTPQPTDTLSPTPSLTPSPTQ